jgi:hypothetical protein
MDHQLELTKANRLKIARAFRGNKRVDFSIECAAEGQLGKVFVDDPSQPPGANTRLTQAGRYGMLRASKLGESGPSHSRASRHRCPAGASKEKHHERPTRQGLDD